jgi:hypothetical protein
MPCKVHVKNNDLGLKKIDANNDPSFSVVFFIVLEFFPRKIHWEMTLQPHIVVVNIF